MKKVITFLFALFLINTSYGQGHFEEGSNVLGVGIGIGSSYSGFTYGSQTPAINIQFEHGMSEIGGPGVISLGGFVGFKSFTYDYGFSNYTTKWSYTTIGVRGAYHYNGIQSDKFDIYGGLMLADRIISVSDNNPGVSYGASASGITFDGFIGGRYYVSSNFSIFAEIGSGISILDLGVAYKF